MNLQSLLVHLHLICIYTHVYIFFQDLETGEFFSSDDDIPPSGVPEQPPSPFRDTASWLDCLGSATLKIPQIIRGTKSEAKLEALRYIQATLRGVSAHLSSLANDPQLQPGLQEGLTDESVRVESSLSILETDVFRKQAKEGDLRTERDELDARLAGLMAEIPRLEREISGQEAVVVPLRITTAQLDTEHQSLQARQAHLTATLPRKDDFSFSLL